ncbi:hypothetical protein ABVK25_009697 [Lepraria finkii]|uniref:Uncharacterized protein n=1 Tax=Lepraria finkii TaxID=1340010 RepID=A0ABR4AYS6_9LECA
MFRPTQVLQALKSIIWSSNSIYASSPGMRGAVEAAVKDHYKNQQLEKRNVEKATIRGPFHETIEDKTEHLTVDFQT